MKDFIQDNRLSAIEQDDIQQFNRTKSNMNTDIQYLLTFIQLKQGARQQQQLILNKGQQKNNKQEQMKRILDQYVIHSYIEENSSRQSQSYQDRANLISFIDMGLRIINRVKALMTRKKQQIKNGTKPNKLGLIKQLFFPVNNNSKVNGSNVNSNNISINTRQLQQQKQQIDKLQMQQQLCILLHKVQTEIIQTKEETAHYRYMVSISMYEQLQLQQKSVSSKNINCIKQRKVIVELINKLQLQLSKLQIVVSGKNKIDQSQIQQTINSQLQNVWGLVGQLSSVLN